MLTFRAFDEFDKNYLIKMGEILAQWVSVGDRFYQRTEIYGETWSKQLSSFEKFTPAPYGGPILVVHDNTEIHIHQVRCLVYILI